MVLEGLVGLFFGWMILPREEKKWYLLRGVWDHQRWCFNSKVGCTRLESVPPVCRRIRWTNLQIVPQLDIRSHQRVSKATLSRCTKVASIELMLMKLHVVPRFTLSSLLNMEVWSEIYLAVEKFVTSWIFKSISLSVTSAVSC